MNLRIIKSPSAGTVEMIRRRIALSGQMDTEENVDAIGLVQGQMIDMLCAADIAEKAVGVKVYDVRGVCPQHMSILALFGDTASVADALQEIDNKLKEGKYNDYSQNY